MFCTGEPVEKNDVMADLIRHRLKIGIAIKSG